jgi:hypothetical protein
VNLAAIIHTWQVDLEGRALTWLGVHLDAATGLFDDAKGRGKDVH